MVKLLFKRSESFLDFGEIEHPAELRIYRPLDMHLDAKAMPVHPPAFVAGWNIGEPVSCFDMEFLEYFHHCLLPNPYQLVRLHAEPPLWVLQTVSDCELRVYVALRAVHRLQEKMPEFEIL